MSDAKVGSSKCCIGNFLNEDCHSTNFSRKKGDLSLEDLSNDSVKLLEVRTGYKCKEGDSLYHHHEKVLLSRYQRLKTSCADPFQKHKKPVTDAGNCGSVALTSRLYDSVVPSFTNDQEMPSDMRFQCPSEDTPPSTRPPSVASSAPSTSGTPRRSASMDSLQTNSSMDKPVGEEYIPTRMIQTTPKANANALQFIKTGPALLHKSAKEQMKKAEVVKSLRKTSLQEEEEWQSTQSSPVSSNVVDEASDWQTNLDKWKSGRRKRNEDVLERVIEVKKFEQQDELEGFRGRRKSKTFNEMREEKNRRGRRYNLVVHDDDNNDLSDLGLNVSKNGSSLSEPTDDPESTRNADTKSDAGFCTGSDTGSDGVFAEDSISDTSSALGDKREIHDSLESGVSSMLKESEVITNGHHVAVPMTITKKGVGSNLEEYTYAKAIEDYKQFAENSVKKRTSSASSTASGGLKDDERLSVASKKIEDRLSFFDGLEKTPAPLKDPGVLRRDRAQTKVDLDKRRSMFELRDLDQSSHQSDNKRRSATNLSSSSLRHKVASFENVSEAPSRARGAAKAPPRDIKFKEKLASFSLKEKGLGGTAPPKKSPARDQNFYEKLQNFSRMESGEATSPTDWKGPPRTETTKVGFSWRSLPPAPLKDRIASFENLSPTGETAHGRREFSVSMENLHCQRSSSAPEEVRPLNGSQSVSNLFPFRRVPSTPFMVIELEEEEDRREEQPCVRIDVLAPSTAATGTSTPTDYEVKSTKENGERNESKLFPTSSASANVVPQPVSLPRIPQSSPYTRPDHPPPTQSETPPSLISPLNYPEERGSTNPSEIPLGRKPRKLPELPTVTPQVPDDMAPPVPPPRLPTIDNPTDPWVVDSSLGPPFPEAGPTEAETTLGITLNSGQCQYGDGDIDEVINTYEPLSKAVTAGDENSYQELCPPQLPPDHNSQENVYEKIAEDEPVYENIYEKVPDDLDHQYQTVEEVNTQKADISHPLPQSQTLPLRNKSPSVFEVLDVTWTEDGCSVLAAPPSDPPPPPPPEEDLGEEEGLEDLASSEFSGPASTILPSAHVENEAHISEATTSSSPPLVKSSLRKQMSDFLGTKPYVDEEVTLQPPPDVSELLRKEREAERLIVQRQSSLSRSTALTHSDFSASLTSLGRPKYTWEDRMKADGPKSKVDLDESSDNIMEFQAPVGTSSSLHEPKGYQNDVLPFSVKPYVVHNIHNHSLQETFGTKPILTPTSKFPSCESLLTSSDKRAEVGEYQSKTLNSRENYLRKTKSISSLNSSEENDSQPLWRMNSVSSLRSSSSTEKLTFRKAESVGNLCNLRDSFLSCAKWCRSLESINVDSSGNIRENKRSCLYIIPRLKVERSDQTRIRNTTPESSEPCSGVWPRTTSPSHFISTATYTSPTFRTSTFCPPYSRQRYFSQPRYYTTSSIPKANTSHSRTNFTSTSSTFLHDNLRTLIDSAKSPSFASVSGTLIPSIKSSASQSMHELASILALEHNIVELKKKKLAELEQEMEKHDRHMLQKIKGPHAPSHDLTPDPLPQDDISSLPQYSSDLPKTSPLPQYSSDLPKTSEDLNPPLSSNLTSSVVSATHLPIQEFYTAPSFTQYEVDNANTNDCSSASSDGGFVSCSNAAQSIYTESSSINRAVEAKKIEKVDSVSKGAPQQGPPPLPRKSILALSAIPKPRLTDNDSWIMKRKHEPAKRDYSKHWLIQEAEQRRLEQQDRISRPSQLHVNKPTPGYQNHFQNIKSSFHNISPTSYNSTSFSSNSSTGSSNGSSISNSRSTTAYHNGLISSLHPSIDASHKPMSNSFSSTLPTNIVGTNGTSTVPTPTNLKKQTKTYQPPQPSPTGTSKPLPDAIINTITQRVNNKNKMNGSVRPTVYNSTSSCPYRADDSYHDYMNTDSFSSVHTNEIPMGASPMIPASPPQASGHYLPGGNPPPAHGSEDQRLLSVSGKKKCSHCGEELGRGAAMIIESLRLFYHIPCFKCCVCGTQLGNGTSGADVRVRNHKLHCHNCYSNDEGMKFSKV